jgi:hypothetical protein
VSRDAFDEAGDPTLEPVDDEPFGPQRLEGLAVDFKTNTFWARCVRP